MASAPSTVDWIATHRAQWGRKAGLRIVYESYFRRLREGCVPDTPILELGCGPGFFKERYPEVIATDVVNNPRADAIIDAAALPFGDTELGNIVMLDVFHHLPAPARFLREAARTLRRGGRLLMIEPWIGLAGRAFYTWVHHEICDTAVRPDAPWDGPGKDPMDGNVALPFLYFRDNEQLDRLRLPLRLVRRDPFAALPWLLSGGFQPLDLLPARLYRLAQAVDRLLSTVPWLTAIRCFIVIEKPT